MNGLIRVALVKYIIIGQTKFIFARFKSATESTNNRRPFFFHCFHFFYFSSFFCCFFSLLCFDRDKTTETRRPKNSVRVDVWTVEHKYRGRKTTRMETKAARRHIVNDRIENSFSCALCTRETHRFNPSVPFLAPHFSLFLLVSYIAR